MTLPMAVVALVSWLKNPYQGNKAEVKVNEIKEKEWSFAVGFTVAVTVAFLVNDLYGFFSWQKMQKRQNGE